jgi:hypothetical protein
MEELLDAEMVEEAFGGKICIGYLEVALYQDLDLVFESREYMGAEVALGGGLHVIEDLDATAIKVVEQSVVGTKTSLQIKP